MILCVLLFLAAGCNPKNNDGPETLYGSVARPVWSAPADYDDISSMTAVVQVDLRQQYPELAADHAINGDDLLGAFDGERCLGVASPNEGLFLLYIANTEGTFALRYYSAQYRNIFAAAPIAYQTDVRLGTPDHPYTPAFVLIR